ncbi:hypothetical protein [Cellulomonas sp. ATA003]|uniref:hypothetical protein n=1 Tax=Cellulomonas sp. ATA003 TaxID=3073064 RepID=UPI002872D006|nr:hypothetical protein [Cellulomonas sp. ATA003]WNB85836.1 hypothetical protein REH70_00325 [Cellulomonas sp. ATA003]
MRRRLLALLCSLSLIAGLNLLVAPAASAHPFCGQVWGSHARSVGSCPTVSS